MRKNVHPLDRANTHAAKALSLFEVANMQLDTATAMIKAHKAATSEAIAKLQAELVRADQELAKNQKVAAKLADFVR